MKFSRINDALEHKYRDGESPKDANRRKMLDKVFYACAAIVLIASITFNVLWATGALTRGNDGAESPKPWPTPNVPEEIKFNVIDRSKGVKALAVEEKRVNQPCVYGHELLFSAGTGNLEHSVLTNLYLFDAITGKTEKVAQSSIKDGEIYETYLSENWIVWLDTDHKGKNIIYKKNRVAFDNIPAGTVSVVQETENHMPRLGLYGNYLVWMEQISDKQDKLYFVDLTTDENMALQLFENTNYAVSTPFIYKNMVLWAEKDPDSSDESKSAIYNVVFEELGQSSSNEDNSLDEDETDDETSDAGEEDSGELEPEIFKTGTYVHKPICNDDIFVWIDKNNAPDSNLYYAYKSGATAPVMFWKNVTQYSLGDDFIAFVSNQMVYAYYYKSNILVQVSEAGRSAILPQAFGSLVVWEDKTDTSGKDVFKYNVLG
ncbi:MAG: hypothetical protein IKB86_02065 [Clostridia bacterium]|nr:hypothetical protein [Clostridia bacterium]